MSAHRAFTLPCRFSVDMDCQPSPVQSPTWDSPGGDSLFGGSLPAPPQSLSTCQPLTPVDNQALQTPAPPQSLTPCQPLTPVDNQAFPTPAPPQSLTPCQPLTPVDNQAFQTPPSSPPSHGPQESGSPSHDPACPSREGMHLIQLEDISLGQLLGRGGFGAVHLAAYRGQTVAVKTFSCHSRHEILSDTYQRELNALRCGLQHCNVVSLLGATCVHSWQAGACIVMQYAGRENLQSYILNSNNSLTLDLVLSFSSQAVAGLGHLHSKKLIHLDIKPANCLVDAENGNSPVLRITDYGLSTMEMEPWSPHHLGTVPFRAPELFCGSAPSYSSDVYSLAVLMWCLDTRQLPFQDLSPEAVIWRTVQYKMRPAVPDHCAHPLLSEFRQIYTGCWSAEPADRPVLEDVLSSLSAMQQRPHSSS